MSYPRFFLKLLILYRAPNNHVRAPFRSLSALKSQIYSLKKQLRISRKDMKMTGDPNLLQPPENIRGLKNLDLPLFEKSIKVPTVNFGDVLISKAAVYLKKYMLKMENLKPMQNWDGETFVMLNPVYVTQWQDIEEGPRNSLEKFGINESNFKIIDFTLNYYNWRADELLRAILPEDNVSVAGYSKIGHILHLNLREHVIEYKEIIGQILLDKVHGVRTVVNKLDKIDSTYRNFEMEVLCGDPDMFVQVKENRCTFEFDFSTVYWNPRLSTEHERITNKLVPDDVLYDVFAGVGPFSIPIAKKKCFVLANDLNPESFNWLNHNAKLNKIKDNYLRTFNKDGREFICVDIKNDLKSRIKNPSSNIHITMNLPAIAPTFLDAFCGLYNENELDLNIIKFPIVHCYCFAKGENPVEIARDMVEANLKCKLTDNLIEIFNVRKVSSNKEMMRISFKLTRDILLGKKRNLDEELLLSSKKCV